MAQAEEFVALLVAVVLVALAARRFERLPHAVALVLGGVAAGLLPFAPEVHVDPEVVFVAFLPPILYPTAFAFATEDVRSNLRPIGFLALGLVLATVAAVAGAVHLAVGIPWGPAFVLGAVLAPTDPVAATAVIRTTGAPSRLATVVEGESLVNDGTGLTALKIAITATGGTVSVIGSIGDFALVALGGIVVGAALGWLTSRLRRRLDELELESTIAVLLAYGAFILADRLGLSGVLAVVSAGLVMGSTDDVATGATRVGGQSFWAVASFLAESILFLLVGLVFAQLLNEPASRSAPALAAITALVIVVVLGLRLVWMHTVPFIAGLLRPGDRRLGAEFSTGERTVIGVCGLRGALSMAAALSIPAQVGGGAFPERTTIIVVAVAAVVVLLVGPALSLPAVLSATGLGGSEDREEEERRIRAALAEAALNRAEELAAEGDVPDDVLERVRMRYELRLRRYRDHEAPDDAPSPGERAAALRELLAATVEAERRQLRELRRGGEVHGELLREIERDLDIDELRLH